MNTAVDNVDESLGRSPPQAVESENVGVGVIGGQGLKGCAFVTLRSHRSGYCSCDHDFAEILIEPSECGPNSIPIHGIDVWPFDSGGDADWFADGFDCGVVPIERHRGDISTATNDCHSWNYEVSGSKGIETATRQSHEVFAVFLRNCCRE